MPVERSEPRSAQRLGLLQGTVAYALWGGVAVYWKLLAEVPAAELTAHRALWGLLAFLVLVVVLGRRPALAAAVRSPRVLATMALSGALLAVNWGFFVWATVAGRLLDASLGYFMNPLVSVALGTLVLRERLSRLAWVAIGLAAIGVGVLTWRVGRVPWVALILAGTFGLYGLVRKTAPVDALVGSTVETLLIAPFALGFLAIHHDTGAFGHASAATHLLLVGTGVVTAIPLVLFTSAAKRLPLSTIGFLQYLAPTGQFLLAVIAFGEPLALDRLAGFVVIWAALLLFSYQLWRAPGAAGASASSAR